MGRKQEPREGIIVLEGQVEKGPEGVIEHMVGQ